jgi:hypothetical protein
MVKGEDLRLKVVTDSNKDLAKQAEVPEGYAVQCGVIVEYATAEDKFSLGEGIKKGEVQYLD